MVAKADLKSLPFCHLLSTADMLLVLAIGEVLFEEDGGVKPLKPPFVKT